MKKITTALAMTLLTIAQPTMAEQFSATKLIHSYASSNSICVEIDAAANTQGSIRVNSQMGFDSAMLGHRDMTPETHSISTSRPFVQCMSMDMIEGMMVSSAYFSVNSVAGHTVTCRKDLSTAEIIAKTYHFTVSENNGQYSCSYTG